MCIFLTQFFDIIVNQDLMLTFWQEFEHRGLTPDPGAFTLLIRGMAFANHELAFQLNERLVVSHG